MQKDLHNRNWYPRSGYSMLDNLCRVLAQINSPIVVYDTETTGTSKNSYIVQYAGLRIEPRGDHFEITQTLDQLIKPPIPMPKGASDVNHITDDMLKDQPTEAIVIDKIDAFMQGALVAGYNHISFDNNMLNNMYLRTKGYEFPGMKKELNFDAMIMAKALLNRGEIGNGRFQLGPVGEMYGIRPDENEQLHDALADTKVTMKLIWALARDYNDSDTARYYRSLTPYSPRIEIYGMHRMTYSKTSDYVMINVSCQGESGQFRYEVYDKRYVEISGHIMEMGNMEQFIIDADQMAGGDIAKLKVEE